jgi:hypothetical protein
MAPLGLLECGVGDLEHPLKSPEVALASTWAKDIRLSWRSFTLKVSCLLQVNPITGICESCSSLPVQIVHPGSVNSVRAVNFYNCSMFGFWTASLRWTEFCVLLGKIFLQITPDSCTDVMCCRVFPGQG